MQNIAFLQNTSTGVQLDKSVTLDFLYHLIYYYAKRAELSACARRIMVMKTINANEIPEVLLNAANNQELLEYIIQQLPQELHNLTREFVRKCYKKPLNELVAPPRLYTKNERLAAGNLYAVFMEADVTITFPIPSSILIVAPPGCICTGGKSQKTPTPI